MNSTNRVRHDNGLTKEQKYKKIWELVKKHGFSQKEACEKYDINEKTFSAWKIKQDPRSSLRVSVSSSVRKSPLTQKTEDHKNGKTVWRKTVDNHSCFEKMEITVFENDEGKFVVVSPKIVLIMGKPAIEKGATPSFNKDLFTRFVEELKKQRKTYKQFQAEAVRSFVRGEWKFRML